MMRRENNLPGMIFGADVEFGESEVAAGLFNWACNIDPRGSGRILYSYKYSPEEILNQINSIEDVVITSNGDIGYKDRDETSKLGEYKLIASQEHSFNAVVCYFRTDYDPDNNYESYLLIKEDRLKYDLDKAFKKSSDIVADLFYITTDVVAIGFGKYGDVPIAQQVYDSQIWDDSLDTKTTTCPEWFSAIQNKKSSSSSGPSGSSGGCYVATAVYGSYDCPQVWTLRRYRDFELAEHWYGRIFIHVYYAVSPTIVKWFGETEWFNKVWRRKLDSMVDDLQRRGYSDSPYVDKNW